MRNQISLLAAVAAMALGLGATTCQAQVAAAAPIAKSEIFYPGASTSRAFVATEPYLINIMGVMKTSNLRGKPRTFDFGGDIPFVNPATTGSDPNILQGWDPSINTFANLSSTSINNTGLARSIEKRSGQLMVRYVGGDGLTGSTPKSALVSYAVPPRTHVRFDIQVSFGGKDLENNWVLTKSGTSPVLFWQLKSPNAGDPPLAAVVDTDPKDPTKLFIKIYRKAGKDLVLSLVGSASGLPTATPITLTIEAFLDERELAAGGKGRVKAWINNTLVGDVAGPTLSLGPNEHYVYAAIYPFNELKPSPITRTAFFDVDRMLVYP
jgi:hypothetical protein